jgi:hypothetical protein
VGLKLFPTLQNREQKKRKKNILEKKKRFVFFFQTSNLHLIIGLGLGEASPTDLGQKHKHNLHLLPDGHLTFHPST